MVDKSTTPKQLMKLQSLKKIVKEVNNKVINKGSSSLPLGAINEPGKAPKHVFMPKIHEMYERGMKVREKKEKELRELRPRIRSKNPWGGRGPIV